MLVRFLSAPEGEFAQFYRIGSQRGPTLVPGLNASTTRKYKKRLEARVGIEPTHKGFADLSLTTWVPRPKNTLARVWQKVYRGPSPWAKQQNALTREGSGTQFWSGRRDLNPRLRPWQGRTLPLSYSRG